MIKSLHLHNRFFVLIGLVVVLFVGSHTIPVLFSVALASLLLLVALTVIDFLSLRSKARKVIVERIVADQLSLGDSQEVKYRITNSLSAGADYVLYDELPMQLQIRVPVAQGLLDASEEVVVDFPVRPTDRGIYIFDKLQLLLTSRFLKLVEYRKSIDAREEVAVYPSIIQMRKYELQVFSKTATLSGIRKIRSIGENDEFEYLKTYTQGDNVKSINWKATSRRNELIVNQYQNTRSQAVYCVVDKGRSMKMPFGGLTLLDHAINSTLVLSNIILRKFDNAGLITFSDKIGSLLAPKGMKGQLPLIARKLYDQKTNYLESNFELLYYTCKKFIKRRSIILLFTNFEQPIDMKRNLPYLRSLAKQHLLIVVYFRNTEVEQAGKLKATKKSEIFDKTFAEMNMIEKEEIAMTLNRNGIDTILTSPENLSIAVINKYLEIKAKRLR